MKKIVLSIILLALSACSTASWQKLSVDYTDEQLDENEFEITFLMYDWIENLETKIPKDKFKISFFDGKYDLIYIEQLSDSGLLNSAEFTMKKGYRYFSIVDARYEFTSGPRMATVTILCFNNMPEGMDYFEAEYTARLIKQKYGIK